MQHPMNRCKPDATKAMLHRKPNIRHNIGLKDTSMESDKNARFCNRVGCHGRLKYDTLNARIGSSSEVDLNPRVETSDKAKFSIKPSFSSSKGNVVGASSPKGLFLDSKRKKSPQSESDPLGSCQSSELEVSPRSKILTKHRLTPKNESSDEVRPRKVLHHKFEQNNQHNHLAFFVPSIPKISSSRTLDRSDNSRRNISCSNNSSSLSSNSSTGGSNSSNSSGCCSSSARKNVMKNKKLGAENSQNNGHLCPSAERISIFVSGRSNRTSGDSKSTSRRLVNVNSGRPRLSSCIQSGRIHNSSLNISRPSFHGSHLSSGSSLRDPPVGNLENQPNTMPFTASELDLAHFLNHDTYNMNEIAEILSAIERIEHDEELTRQQVLARETNLFVSGLNLYDRHEDMRLDIDNMSYEELLALEEKMGTVSTAVSEEALSECIKTSIYETGPPGVRLVESGEDGDDLKCSICQEEYIVGDELGMLVGCLHEYHLPCINQWLGLKNWCPVCKASAALNE